MAGLTRDTLLLHPAVIGVRAPIVSGGEARVMTARAAGIPGHAPPSPVAPLTRLAAIAEYVEPLAALDVPGTRVNLNPPALGWYEVLPEGIEPEHPRYC